MTPDQMLSRIKDLETALFPFSNAAITLSGAALNGRTVRVETCDEIAADDAVDIAVMTVSCGGGVDVLCLSHFLRARIVRDGLDDGHPAVRALHALSAAAPTERQLLKIYLDNGWDTFCPFDTGLDDEGKRRALAEWNRRTSQGGGR